MAAPRKPVHGSVSKEAGWFGGVAAVAPRRARAGSGPPGLPIGDNAWLEEKHGISKKARDAVAERARLKATAAWAPYRSVGYLLINAAKGAAPESFLA